jgi:hypothetical protein
MLFDDNDRAATEAERTSSAAKAKFSHSARHQPSTPRIPPRDGAQSMHSLQTLLATVTRNTSCFAGQQIVLATTTPIQRQAFGLLRVELATP